MKMDWKDEVRSTGALRELDGEHGVNGWSSPCGNEFSVRGANFLTKKVKVLAGESLMKPLGMDWLKSASKLDHVLSRPDNRVMASLRRAQASGKALKAFILGVNLQLPDRENHSAVFYYAAEDPIPVGSLLHRFINGGDAFRNQRFKLLNRVIDGPWIVRKAVGNHAACLLGKAVTCRYLRGNNYLEIDVDIGSSKLASAIIHMALGYITFMSVDLGFLVEGREEDELPERLIGAVRVRKLEPSSAVLVLPHSVSASENHDADSYCCVTARLARACSRVADAEN